MQLFKNADSRRRFRIRSILPWLVAVALAAILISTVVLHRQRRPPAPHQVSYSTLLADLAQHRVASLQIEPGREIRGRWRSAGPRLRRSDVICSVNMSRMLRSVARR